MPCCRALMLTGLICARSQQSVWHAVLTPSPSALYHLFVTVPLGHLGFWGWGSFKPVTVMPTMRVIRTVSYYEPL